MWLGHANRTPNVAPMRADRNGAGWWDKGNIVAPGYAGFFFWWRHKIGNRIK